MVLFPHISQHRTRLMNIALQLKVKNEWCVEMEMKMISTCVESYYFNCQHLYLGKYPTNLEQFLKDRISRETSPSCLVFSIASEMHLLVYQLLSSPLCYQLKIVLILNPLNNVIDRFGIQILVFVCVVLSVKYLKLQHKIVKVLYTIITMETQQTVEREVMILAVWLL